MKTSKKNILFFLAVIPLTCVGISIHFRYSSLEPAAIRRVTSRNLNEQGRWKEMVIDYEPLVSKYPHRTDLSYALGWAYYKTGNLAEAKKQITRYVGGNPFYPHWQQHYIDLITKTQPERTHL